MLLSSQSTDIKEDPNYGLNCLHFTFKGKFTEESSIIATKIWSAHLDSNPNTVYSFIWDCSAMTGFELSARKEWSACMQTHKDKISEITIVSENIIIRGAARLMLQFFGIPLVVVKSFEELPKTA